jgi:hypothetical protein
MMHYGFTLPLVMLVLVCARANAASIVNMDEVPRNFVVDVLGERQEVTLLPWRKIEIASSQARIVMGDYVSDVLEPTAQYAIWPGSTLSMQKNNNQSGNFN